MEIFKDKEKEITLLEELNELFLRDKPDSNACVIRLINFTLGITATMHTQLMDLPIQEFTNGISGYADLLKKASIEKRFELMADMAEARIKFKNRGGRNECKK